MGGLALKNTFTRRYQREEFDVVSKELLDILRDYFVKAEMPLFFSNKESFGDADILVAVNASTPAPREFIEEHFNPNEIFHNGNCWSFDYKELQVDLITCSEEDFATNIMYLSYNDLGNMIGRLAHMIGLKYGQEGLWYEHYFKNKNIGSIVVSKDYPKIFSFLDLDYTRYLAGFEDLTDVFEFVSKSKYFNPRFFQLDKLNKINRDRNKKRKSYVTLLEWIDSKYDLEKDAFFEPNDDRTAYFIRIDDYFPEADLITEVRKLEYLACKDLYMKSKFNGAQVMLRFGLKGSELGAALEGFKNYIRDYGDKDMSYYNEYIIERPRELIYKDFEGYLKTIAK